jgi:hypothetical protein
MRVSLQSVAHGWKAQVTLVVRQGYRRLNSFRSRVIGEPGHGATAASFMGERVGGPMAFELGFNALGVEPDRDNGMSVARAT